MNTNSMIRKRSILFSGILLAKIVIRYNFIIHFIERGKNEHNLYDQNLLYCGLNGTRKDPVSWQFYGNLY